MDPRDLPSVLFTLGLRVELVVSEVRLKTTLAESKTSLNVVEDDALVRILPV